MPVGTLIAQHVEGKGNATPRTGITQHLITPGDIIHTTTHHTDVRHGHVARPGTGLPLTIRRKDASRTGFMAFFNNIPNTPAKELAGLVLQEHFHHPAGSIHGGESLNAPANLWHEGAQTDFPSQLAALATSTMNTYDGPNMLERKTTHLLSGVKMGLGSNAYWWADMFTSRSVSK